MVEFLDCSVEYCSVMVSFGKYVVPSLSECSCFVV